MHYRSISLTALLACQIAVAAYLPIRPVHTESTVDSWNAPTRRHADGAVRDADLPYTVTGVQHYTPGIAYSAPPVYSTVYSTIYSFSYDPLPTYSYDPEYTSTLFSYDPPAQTKRDDAGMNPINGLPLPIPSPRKTTKHAPAAATHSSSAGKNPINGLPVPSSSGKPTKTHTPPKAPNLTFESPNPTAMPSTFPTKPFSSLVITPLTMTTVSGSRTYIPVPSKKTDSAGSSRSTKRSSTTRKASATIRKKPMSSSTTMELRKSSTTPFQFYSEPPKEKETSEAQALATKSSSSWEYPYPSKSESSGKAGVRPTIL